MVIDSKTLKALIKSLGTSKSDSLLVDTDNGRLISQEPDITVVVQSDVLKASQGAFSVNARKFGTVVNRMSKDIDITISGSSITLKSAKAKIDIEVKKAKLPPLAAPKDVRSLPLNEVKSLLSFSLSAASTNKAAATGGVIQLISESQGIEEEKIVGMRAAGTDDKRIAFQSSSVEMDGSGFRYLIPIPAVAVINGMSGDALQVAESTSHFYFSDGQIMAFAAKLNKQFPDYQSFIPKSFTFAGSVRAEELKESLRLIDPMVEVIEANGTRPVKFHFLDGNLNISTVGTGSRAEDAIDFHQETPDPMFEEAEFTSVLDHGFVMAFVSSVSGDILFKANTPQQPILFESGDKKYLLAAVQNV
jgi:DNA polymerase III sliding clamp (beta) subunit (PCNA family)